MLALQRKDLAAIERLREAFAAPQYESEEAASFLYSVYPSMQAVLWYRIGNEIYYSGLIEDEALRHHIALEMLFPEGRRTTGIDIDPRAKIGRRFVIDHGAATVIGRHSEIGNDCYILQAVNLGAVPGGSDGKGTNDRSKRHPKIGDNVTIWGYASVLGGIEVGDGCTIGTRCLVTESLPRNSRVRIVNQYQIVRTANEERGGDAEIFGIIPHEHGAFEIRGRQLPQPLKMIVVNEKDEEDLPLAINIIGHHPTIISGTLQSNEATRSAVRQFGYRKDLHKRLIRARLKIQFTDNSVIYVCQAAGLRVAIESALNWEGLWHE